MKRIGAAVLVCISLLETTGCSATGTSGAPGCSTIVGWGDSLTYSMVEQEGVYRQANPTWLETLGRDIGASTVNFGVPTQGSAEIAVRQGGLKPRVTLDGDHIAAGSRNAARITSVVPGDGWTHVARAGTMQLRGSLAGIAGTLQHTMDDGRESFSFLPDQVYSTDIAIRPDSVFTGDEGIGFRDCFQIFWVGANNGPNIAAAQRDLALMVAWMSRPRRYLVVGMIPELQQELLMVYGPRFVDLRQWLIDDGLNATGLLPTYADYEAVKAGMVPPSLLAEDGIHFTQAAYDAIGRQLSSRVKRAL